MCNKKGFGRDNMLCYMIIDLSVLLCTRSDDGAKLVQRQ